MKQSTAAAVLVVLTLVGAASAGCGSSSKDSPRGAGVATAADARFDHPGKNAYFPLVPGTVTRLDGSDEDGSYRERVEVTHRTKMINGVRTIVISDVSRRTSGVLAEKTTDWYATDNAGNVWYFGEDTATYDEHGRLEDRDGTWRAGRDGAVAGLIMPAQPKPTDAYRQEYLAGEAEDQAWIVGIDKTVTVPAGTFRRVVRSYEWSRLEPDVLSLKLYAPGVGIVSERDVAGGRETFKLVSVSH